jgi:hypothetical protein
MSKGPDRDVRYIQRGEQHSAAYQVQSSLVSPIQDLCCARPSSKKIKRCVSQRFKSIHAVTLLFAGQIRNTVGQPLLAGPQQDSLQEPATIVGCVCRGRSQNGSWFLGQITSCQGSIRSSSRSTGPACSDPQRTVQSHQTTEAFSSYRKWVGTALALAGDWMVSDAAASLLINAPRSLCFARDIPSPVAR